MLFTGQGSRFEIQSSRFNRSELNAHNALALTKIPIKIRSACEM